MPRNGSVGYSDNTPFKQKQLWEILRKHMHIVKAIIRKHAYVESTYLYVDLNAGSGRYPINGELIYGSPLQALAVAQQFNIPFQGMLFERDPATLTTLRLELVRFGLTRSQEHPDLFHNFQHLMATICPGDYEVLARDFLAGLPSGPHKLHYGLVYSDENGAHIPFPLLALFAERLPKIDILIHLGTTIPKLLRVSRIHDYHARLDELVHTVPKDFWLIRDGIGQHQWTFLIGTDWDSFPKFRSLGFWPLESPEGANILRKLSLTTSERRAHEQGNLFGDDPWTS